MYYIGVDLGGTNIAVGIVDENYQLVKKESVPTKPERGPDLIVEDMAKVSRKLLSELGIKIDEALNETIHGKLCKISTPDSKTEVWVIPTNEELLIARDTKELCGL